MLTIRILSNYKLQTFPLLDAEQYLYFDNGDASEIDDMAVLLYNIVI